MYEEITIVRMPIRTKRPTPKNISKEDRVILAKIHTMPSETNNGLNGKIFIFIPDPHRPIVANDPRIAPLLKLGWTCVSLELDQRGFGGETNKQQYGSLADMNGFGATVQMGRYVCAAIEAAYHQMESAFAINQYRAYPAILVGEGLGTMAILAYLANRTDPSFHGTQFGQLIKGFIGVGMNLGTYDKRYLNDQSQMISLASRYIGNTKYPGVLFSNTGDLTFPPGIARRILLRKTRDDINMVDGGPDNNGNWMSTTPLRLSEEMERLHAMGEPKLLETADTTIASRMAVGILRSNVQEPLTVQKAVDSSTNPAELTLLVTCMVAADVMSPGTSNLLQRLDTTMVTIISADLLKADPVLKVGDQISMLSLMILAIFQSNQNAASALGRETGKYIKGDMSTSNPVAIAAFIEQMNTFSASRGTTDKTSFVNMTGASATNQKTTAGEFYKLLAYAPTNSVIPLLMQTAMTEITIIGANDVSRKVDVYHEYMVDGDNQFGAGAGGIGVKYAANGTSPHVCGFIAESPTVIHLYVLMNGEDRQTITIDWGITLLQSVS